MSHSVYMRFERVLGSWRVSFISQNRSATFRDLTFAHRNKVWQVAERAGALKDLAAKQGFEMGLKQGMGGIMLALTDEQIGRLRR